MLSQQSNGGASRCRRNAAIGLRRETFEALFTDGKVALLARGNGTSADRLMAAPPAGLKCPTKAIREKRDSQSSKEGEARCNGGSLHYGAIDRERTHAATGSGAAPDPAPASDWLRAGGRG